MRKLQRKSTTVGSHGDAVIRPLCVTVDEAADMLSVGRTTVYFLMVDQEIEAIKIGKSTRITTASLDAFLARKSQPYGS